MEELKNKLNGKNYLRIVSKVDITISTIASIMFIFAFIGKCDREENSVIYLIGCAISILNLLFGLIGLAVDDIRNKLK